MIALDAHTKVYLARGHTDMRCQIDGLAARVEDVLRQDPFSSHLFVFCNRARDKIKGKRPFQDVYRSGCGELTVKGRRACLGVRAVTETHSRWLWVPGLRRRGSVEVGT
jgi:hypothetical protein